MAKHLWRGPVGVASLGVLVLTATLSPRPSADASCGAWIETPAPASAWGTAVSAFALGSDDVWAVGFGMARHGLVARWDGRSWSLVKPPTFGTGADQLAGIGGLAADDLWVTGAGFTGPRLGSPHPAAAHWDGSRCSTTTVAPTGAPQGGLGDVEAVATDDVWSVGWSGDDRSRRTLIEHWDGVRWTVSPTPRGGASDADLTGISAAGSNDVWAVGVDRGPPTVHSLVLHWNGSDWSRVVIPALAPTEPDVVGVRVFASDVAAVAPDDIWIAATGDETVREGNHLRSSNAFPVFVHWDGRMWMVVRAAAPANGFAGLSAIAGRSSTDHWAVGEMSGTGAGEPVVYHFDGHAWAVVPSPTIPPVTMHMDDFRRNRLSSVTISPDGDVWAIGERVADAPEGLVPLVERYCPSE